MSSPAPGVSTTPAGDVSLAASPAMRYPANAPVGNPDPRVGLKPGAAVGEAGEAAWNIRLLSNVPPSEGFTGRGATGSDLAFKGHYVIQGNYRGIQIWDIANARSPRLVVGFLCPASQGDPSVYGNLVFVSGESTGSRNDCGTTNITDTVSMDRFRGIRIIDISDMAHPRIVTNVQTCRGSHTHTVVTDPKDKDNVYVYVSGYANVRSATEVPGCRSAPAGDSTSAQFRIEVIRVPLAHPEQAKVINSPHLLADLSGRTVHAPPPSDTGAGRGGRGGGRGAGGRGGDSTGVGGRGGRGADTTVAGGRGAGGRGGRAGGGAGAAPGAAGAGGGRGGGVGQSGCHDITSYSDIGLAAGACAGYGLLFDIRDAKNPKRVAVVADSNMSFWHSATFSNDGSKLLFSDEWGGGSAPRCRATDPLEWGGNAIFTLDGTRMQFRSYYKMPAPQTDQETCTAHNGSLIPVPGRDIMVQAFYQGGLTVFDWTDPSHPVEIAFFDRGPGGGYWSSYWYNGYIVSSDETRGMDIHELTPGPYLSQNEIDAAKSVHFDEFNTQAQSHIVWPPTFALARAYVDQLERNGGLPAGRVAAIRNDLAAAERANGSARSAALKTIASQIAGDAGSTSDKGRVARLKKAVEELALAK
jgi:hypothetical protein